MICINCNNSITRQDVICPNCQSRTGIQTVGMLYASIVLSALGVILGFGPILYLNALASGALTSPTNDLGQSLNFLFIGIAVTLIGALIGLVGLILLVISLSQKRYRKAR